MMQDYFSKWTLESGFLECVINFFASPPTAKRGFALTLRLGTERNFGSRIAISPPDTRR